jgi:hypothetical protein
MAIIMQNRDEIKYQEALKRVKRIKGFYKHLIVYVVINTIIIFSKIEYTSTGKWYIEHDSFSIVFFWGIGLLAHGLSVFIPSLILGKNWEEKKVKELMEQEKQRKWE